MMQTTMQIIFCEDPMRPRHPDEAFQAETDAVDALGLPRALINYEALVQDDDPIRAVRHVTPPASPSVGIYRGWMMQPQQYAALYDALVQKGIHLINDPAAYLHCHHLPESYPVIAAHTPHTVWLPNTTRVPLDVIMTLLQPFGDRAVILKDFVKSQKHYWHEACFIPRASDPAAVERVLTRFLALQGEDLSGGLVFREFLPLIPVATHPQSGMPLSKEYRTFVMHGEPVYTVPSWREVDDQAGSPPPGLFQQVMGNVRSDFFTMDVAQRANGDWVIVELGDAQVAGLPEQGDARRFYEVLRAGWQRRQAT